MGEIIKNITIQGFKSIRNLDAFELKNMNVLIGANGAGKSNFVSFFVLLRNLIQQNLRRFIAQQGGADACLYLGPRETKEIKAELSFGDNGYRFSLAPTARNELTFTNEETVYTGHLVADSGPSRKSFGSGHFEAKLKNHRNDSSAVFESISNWVVYHFHDTSSVAGVRRPALINDNETLRPNAENLAAFLFRTRATHPEHYARILDVVRLAAPYFDDFNLRPVPATPDLIQLEWRQRDSDRPFLASQLSDGTLRFICLATALNQPLMPATMLFDEPELGLHPYALSLLAALFKKVVAPKTDGILSGIPSGRQIIVSTQSSLLLNEFAPEDIVVVERSEGQSGFHRLDAARLADWLSDYTLGDLWQKNLLGGRPQLDLAGLRPA